MGTVLQLNRTVSATWGFFVIILEPKHTQQLIDHLKENPLTPSWDQEKIIATLQDDLDEKEIRTTCEHSIRTLTGKKTCCIKCGGFRSGDGRTPGDGFSWKLDEVASELPPI